MRNAFTMIELIFVIVIIGILAAVAIPKLSATRDDAKKVQLISNTIICINDLVASYQASSTVYTIANNKACVQAIDSGASINYSGDSIVVSGVSSALNHSYPYKGYRVSF